LRPWNQDLRSQSCKLVKQIKLNLLRNLQMKNSQTRKLSLIATTRPPNALWKHAWMVNAIMKILNHKSQHQMPNTLRRLVATTKPLSVHLKYVMMVNAIMKIHSLRNQRQMLSIPRVSLLIATTKPLNAHQRFAMTVNAIMRNLMVKRPSSLKKNQLIATTRPPNALLRHAWMENAIMKIHNHRNQLLMLSMLNLLVRRKNS